jgi:hypothetical protein
MLADTIVVVHLFIVLFVLTGVPLVYLGAARHWAWVRNWRWRLLHLIAIAVIAAESLFGVACPLTVWEDRLRGEQISTGFIERWVDAVLFYDAPHLGVYRCLRRLRRAGRHHLDRGATD